MMGIRDLVLTAVVFAVLPFCFLHPWIGALAWAWLGYMNPHRLTFGFAFGIPFAMMVAIATLAGFLATRDRKPFIWTRETVLLMALWVWFGVTTLFAQYPEWAVPKLVEVSKILLMALLTIPLFQNRRRLRWLLFVIAGSLAFYGVKGGIYSLLYGGQATILGPPHSFISTGNELGLAMNMVVPVLVFLAREEQSRWIRLGLRAAAFLTIVAICFTYSRGAVVGLVVVLAMLFLKARQRVLVALALVVAVVALMSFAPPRWMDRMETLTDYQGDTSVQRRLTAWWVGYQVALDHPITGGGFRVFWDSETYHRYGAETGRAAWRNEDGQDAHSIYFNLLGEHGWIGLGLFMALMLSTFLTLRRVRKQVAGQPGRSWIASYAHMLQVSLLVYLVSGASLSAAYFDLAYQLILIAVVLQRMATADVAAEIPARTVPVRPALRPRRPRALQSG